MHENEPIILVVDDTEDNLDLLEFALKRKPVRMIRATSGKECLVVAEEKKPDIILLDIQMPEMDGFETIKRLRANPATAKIPVIFLTAQRKDADSIATGLALGAEGCDLVQLLPRFGRHALGLIQLGQEFLLHGCDARAVLVAPGEVAFMKLPDALHLGVAQPKLPAQPRFLRRRADARSLRNLPRPNR